MEKHSLMRNYKFARCATNVALVGAIMATPLVTTTSAFAAENAPTFTATSAAELACGEPNIALVMDETWSFSDNEQNQKAEGIKSFLREYAKIPNAKVTLYHFGQTSPSFGQVLSVNLSDSGALEKALNFVFTAEQRSQTAGEGLPEVLKTSDNWSGTNWAAALKTAADLNETFDAVVFATDGSPNKYVDAAGNYVNPGSSTYSEEAFNAAKEQVAKVLGKGTKVIPLFIKTKENSLGGAYTPEREAQTTNAIKEITGKTNPVDGVDYITSDTGSDAVAKAFYNAATATCPTDLKIDKSVDLSEVQPGQEVTYTLTVKNAGEWDEPNASVKDEGITITGTDGKSIKGENVTISNPSIGTAKGTDWTIGALKAGESATATVKFTVPLEAQELTGATVANSAYVTGSRDPYDGNSRVPNPTVDGDTDNWDNATSKITPAATNVKVNKELATPIENVKPGDTIEYKVQIKNDSKVTEPNFIFNEFPNAKYFDGAATIDNQGRGTVEGNTWKVGAVKAGETISFSVKLKLKDTVSIEDLKAGIENAVTVTGDYDPKKPTPKDPSNPAPPTKCEINPTVDADTDGCDIVTTPINEDVRIAKTETSGELKAGERATFEFKVTNKGSDTARDVYVSEGELKGLDASTLTWGEKPSMGKLVTGAELVKAGVAKAGSVDEAKTYWLIGDLKVDEVVTAQVSAQVSENAEEVENTATVNSRWDKHDPSKPKQPNNTPDEDTDNWDNAVKKVTPKPTPTPSTPAPEPTASVVPTPEVTQPPAPTQKPSNPVATVISGVSSNPVTGWILGGIALAAAAVLTVLGLRKRGTTEDTE